MKYLTDEHIPLLLAQLLRAAGIDARTVQECGLRGRTDDVVLRYAAAEGRAVVTANCKDFKKFTTEFLAGGLPHAGVICFGHYLQTNEAPGAAAALITYAAENPDGMPTYLLTYLSSSSSSGG